MAVWFKMKLGRGHVFKFTALMMMVGGFRAVFGLGGKGSVWGIIIRG